MAIPNKGLNQIRTLSGRVDQQSLPYRSYMQITCLEMERARRSMERKSASHRVALIDARVAEIDQAKKELLQAVAADGQRAPALRLPGLEVRPAAPRRSMGGFKIRY
jgi:hypothetical protein